MNKEKISMYRVLSISGMILSAILTSAILCILNQSEMEQIVCTMFVLLGFIPIMIFEFIYERKRNLIANNNQTSYRRIAFGFITCCVLMIAVSFMPEFFRPIVLFPLVLSAFGNEHLGLTIGMFANVLLSMTTGGSFYELLAYSLLLVISIILTKVLSENKFHIYIGLLFLFVSILFPNIFYYLAYEQLSVKNLFLSFMNGILLAMFVIVIYPMAKKETEEEIPYLYKQILEENYIQVREVRAYSNAEYQHARKVSKIAKKYAENLHLRVDLCEAAGFYYRLGRWEGNSIVSGGVQKAMALCFPEDLIQILSEYNGEEKKPSTPESALVHIIDALLIKLELLENEVGTSQWNREVLIHQTLNDFSTAGLYDESGLSINAFIKIRQWLATEELLS